MDERLLRIIYGYVDGQCTEAEADEVRAAVARDPSVADELYRAALDRRLLVEVLGGAPVTERAHEAEMARLVVREGEGAGSAYVIRPGTARVVLGRRSGVEFQILDEKASRDHAEVVFSEGRYVLRDLGSSNGTSLDGRRLERDETLRPGSLIRIGRTVIEFLDESGGVPPGLRVSGYDLIERVGRGRMGTVYKARQLSMDRVVAIKILDETCSGDRDFIERFRREARAAARLSHPNIVRMVDVGKSEGLHYYSMEFVEGETLKHLLREQGCIDTDRALEIALQAARALGHAHGRGMVHRDVKPANLLLTREGAVKVADLGIAKTFEASAFASGVHGTPHYMSPEQAAGEELDARTDVFSLGATLYHMLTGSLPFEGDDDYEVARAHTTASLPAVQEREPDVPDSVTRMVERMMARDPALRHQSMGEVASDLERVIADREAEIERVAPGESTISRPVEAIVRRRRRARRRGHGLPSIGALAAAAAILMGIALLYQLVAPGRPGPRRKIFVDVPSGRITHTADGRPLDGLGGDPAVGREDDARPGEDGSPGDDVRATRAVAADRETRPAEGDPVNSSDAPGAREGMLPALSATDTAGPAGPTITDMAAAVGSWKPYPEVAEAAGFCRPGVWEKGALVLRDGRKITGEFRAGKESLSFRRKSTAIPQKISLAEIENIAFRQPSNINAQMGEFELRQGRLDEAMKRFEKALATARDDPFVRKKIADIRATKDAQRKIDDALVAGNHREVLDEIARHVRVLDPQQLSPRRRSALENAWRHVAMARRSDRACWRRTARKLGMRLPEAEGQAPSSVRPAPAGRLPGGRQVAEGKASSRARPTPTGVDEGARNGLAKAVGAAGANMRAAEIVGLFEDALAARVPFDDKHYLLMARAYHELDKDDRARDVIGRMSEEYRERPEVRTLLLGLRLSAPPLRPRLLACTYVGGEGDQHIEEVGFGFGGVYAKGKGFSVLLDMLTLEWHVEGEVNTHDDGRYDPTPPLPGGKGRLVRDRRNGQTYRVGNRQVDAKLQPFVESSAGWKLSGFGLDEIVTGAKTVRSGPLTANSRAYDCWLVPGGNIAVKCWTASASSIVTRDARRLNPIAPLKRHADGMASLFMLVDPEGGKPLSGTFVEGPATRHAVDDFGRVYLPFAQDGSANPFGMADKTRCGLLVLKPSLLGPELNIRIGGGGGEAGRGERFGAIALKDNLLVLGGYTEAAGLKTVNPVQDSHGGGRDGFIVLLELWP